MSIPDSSNTSSLAGRQAVVKSWRTLLWGSLAAGFLALSLHTIMLQVLLAPYPADYPKAGGWPVFINSVPLVLGTSWLTALGWPRLRHFSVATRCLVVVVLVAMLKESLFRRFLMNGWVTTAWRYTFVESLPAFLAIAFYGSCAVLLITYSKGLATRAAAGIATAAALAWALVPLMATANNAILQRIAYLSHEARYGFPYGWQVEVPSYLTFVEPVMACLGVAWLVWPQLTTSPNRRLGAFIGLVILLRGQAVSLPINMVYDHHGPLIGFFSELQFFLEAAALGAGIGLVWSSAIGYVHVQPHQFGPDDRAT